MIKVLLADDYPLIRTILKEFFALNYPQIEVVGEAKNGEEAVRLAKELKPDYVITDVKMPVMDGITAMGLIKQSMPESKIICYTGYRHEVLEQKALAAGAEAFFLKPFDLQDIADVLINKINERTPLSKIN
ncbi:MAG: response regulator [Bacillota bacterium]